MTQPYKFIMPEPDPEQEKRLKSLTDTTQKAVEYVYGAQVDYYRQQFLRQEQEIKAYQSGASDIYDAGYTAGYRKCQEEALKVFDKAFIEAENDPRGATGEPCVFFKKYYAIEWESEIKRLKPEVREEA